MHHFDHALIVLRDLRRGKRDCVAIGHGYQPDEVASLAEGIRHVQEAIASVLKARSCFAKVHTVGFSGQGLTTDALWHIDCFRSRGK
jgi:hypothetical protein